MRPVPALQSGDRGRTALTGKGMALCGIEALARPLERRTLRPQCQAEDDGKKEAECVAAPTHHQYKWGCGIAVPFAALETDRGRVGWSDRCQRRPVAWLGRALRGELEGVERVC